MRYIFVFIYIRLYINLHLLPSLVLQSPLHIKLHLIIEVRKILFTKDWCAKSWGSLFIIDVDDCFIKLFLFFDSVLLFLLPTRYVALVRSSCRNKGVLLLA